MHIFKFLENAIFEAAVVRKKIVRLKKKLIWKCAVLNHYIKSAHNYTFRTKINMLYGRD